MPPLEYILLLICLAIASVTDVRERKIYNWNTYGGVLLVLAIHVVCKNWGAFYESMEGLVVCGGIMTMCFVLLCVGGGDVKMIGMIGAFLGWERGIEVMLWMFTLGGVMGIAILIWDIGAWRLLVGGARHAFYCCKSRNWLPLNGQERLPLQRSLFLAPAALLAVLLQLV